ncbi:hypothetical protein ADK60_15190 [Streptomyces sp. XY431]|uniref:hypothetical protein n=1 Tax=Streptomyces sp. XY431 TaxID=1415562 RepID=UPI0006AFA5AE|nr:hypothetical protein [Streptomyces sp. XY431]KOV31756.1 hypothetical protein ADK60_15190 [Streptomyces sp. XY431]
MPVENDFEDKFEDDFEDGFAQALRGAAALAPEAALFGLAAGAERRGQRRRSRRRAAVAGVAAVAVLAVGGVGVFVDAGPGAGLFGPAAAEPAVDPMTSEEVVELVTGLLPPASVQTVTAETPGVPGPANNKHETFGVLRYDDGRGASLLSYSVERGAQRPEAAAVCMDGFTTPQDSCERTTRPDGSVLVVDKLRDTSFPGKREWRATWATPDGTVIRVTEYNGQPATPTRETPPLDDGQLATLVTSPAWARVVAALPAHPDAPKPDRSPADTPAPAATTPASAELLAKLTKLLPPGAQASGVDEQHAALTVTFEGRTSKISIYAEPAGPRGQRDKKDAEEGLPTPLEVHDKLSDGTLLVLNRFGNGKTAVNPVLHWTAKVYYPDGRNILLNEWNGENGYDYQPGDPALSIEQLKAVITAPDWRR